MLTQESYSSAMNWVSGILGRRASTPQKLPCGLSDSSRGFNVEERSYTSSQTNRRMVGQHSLDQSSFDRFKEYKKDPKRCWKLEPDHIFPDMIGESTILTHNEIVFLDEEKPDRLVGCTWELVFSTEKHGFLLSTLYRNLKSWTGPTLLVVKDNRGHRFGAFVTESFKPDDRIHGGGECFVFRLKHEEYEKLFDGKQNDNEFQTVDENEELADRRHEHITYDSTSGTSEKRGAVLPENILNVNEEHFSQEGLDEMDNRSSSLQYSNKRDQEKSTLTASDIKDTTRIPEYEDLQGVASRFGASPSTRKETKSGSLSKRQKEFLNEFDLREHYVWAWAGDHSCFIHGEDQYLHIGLDDGKVALQIDNMLEKGRSQSSRVFANEPLAPCLSNKHGDFDIVAVEVWLFKQL